MTNISQSKLELFFALTHLISLTPLKETQEVGTRAQFSGTRCDEVHNKSTQCVFNDQTFHVGD